MVCIVIPPYFMAGLVSAGHGEVGATGAFSTLQRGGLRERSACSPAIEDLLDAFGHSSSCLGAIHPRRQKVVVFGLLVADAGDHGQCDDLRIEASPRRR